MKIGINGQYQIKQINNITDLSLRVIEVDEAPNIFKNATDTKILCYCYDDRNGVSIYPYVDIEKINESEKETLELQAQVISLEFEKIGGLL